MAVERAQKELMFILHEREIPYYGFIRPRVVSAGSCYWVLYKHSVYWGRFFVCETLMDVAEVSTHSSLDEHEILERAYGALQAMFPNVDVKRAYPRHAMTRKALNHPSFKTVESVPLIDIRFGGQHGDLTLTMDDYGWFDIQK